MQTRSQSKYPAIDFDEAHVEWIKNKKISQIENYPIELRKTG